MISVRHSLEGSADGVEAERVGKVRFVGKRREEVDNEAGEAGTSSTVQWPKVGIQEPEKPVVVF